MMMRCKRQGYYSSPRPSLALRRRLAWPVAALVRGDYTKSRVDAASAALGQTMLKALPAATGVAVRRQIRAANPIKGKQTDGTGGPPGSLPVAQRDGDGMR